MKATLDPIIHRDGYNAPIENELVEYLRETIYQPLIDILDAHTQRTNAEDVKHSTALWLALIAGAVWYADGQFRGSFSSAISRELRTYGATKTLLGFALAPSELPLAVRTLLVSIRLKNEALHKEILGTLARIEENFTSAPTGLRFRKDVDTVVTDLQKQLAESVSKVKALEVPKLSPQMAQVLTEKLTAGTESAIKGFTATTTADLRAKVQQNFQTGGRAARLREIIEAEYGVGKRRAALIADNETSLLVAAFRQERYEQIGCRQYIWRTMQDSRVRPTHGESNNHRVLDGRVFSWDAPPVVDAATGRRRHPGQDYGPCRCVALPILNLT